MRVALLALLVGCGAPGPDAPDASEPGTSGGYATGRPADDGMGSLRLLLHDAPTTDADEVWISWDEVTVRAVDGTWVTVSDDPASIDLLTLQDGELTGLGLGAIPVGSYDEIRFVLTDAWVVVDGQTEALDVPSGMTSGVKLKVDFAIEDCGDTTVTLDWDVGAHLTENPQGFKLRPVLHATSAYDDGSCDVCLGEITFPDAVLEDRIRTAIGQPTGPILGTDLQVPGMVVLNWASAGITDLSGLECATGTTAYLNLNGNGGLTDLSAVAELSGLTNLYLSQTGVVDISAVADRDLLIDFRVDDTAVTDITAVGTLDSLRTFSGHRTAIADWTPLRSVETLLLLGARGTPLDRTDIFHPSGTFRLLFASGSQISDLSGFPVGSLEYLELTNTPVSDLGPLAAHPTLWAIAVAGTPVSDLSPLAGLPGLQLLRVTNVSDLSPLTGMTTLYQLDVLGAPVTDWSPLATLPALRNLGVRGTSFSDLNGLHPSAELQTLFGGGSDIADLSRLAGSTRLAYVELTGTPVTDPSPVYGLSTLWYLNLSQSGVTDLTGLDGPGVTAFYVAGLPLTDLSPLTGVPLAEVVVLDGVPATDFSVLPSLTSLRRVEVRGTAFDCSGTVAADLTAAGVGIICP